MLDNVSRNYFIYILYYYITIYIIYSILHAVSIWYTIHTMQYAIYYAI